MSGSDAILVGESWISEHYFTTDAKGESFRSKVVERRSFWDAEAKEERPTPRSRFAKARQGLETDLATLAELLGPAAGADQRDGRGADDLAETINERLLVILELTGHGLVLDRQGPLLRVSSPGVTERAPLVVVSARPVAAVEELLARDAVTLREPVRLTEDAEEAKSAARLVSALFVADDAPDLALVLAGRWALLAERERWAEGRYLAVDVQLVCERNDTKQGGEIDRALTCLSAQSIAPDADGKLWWHGVLEASIKHTVGVSKDLRDGVRLSIEIIANEVVARRRDKGLDPLPASEAQPLAKQSLRFLYRILFLLYAEASPELGVLPVGAREYDQGYSLDRLRELVQVELATPRARSGTHLYESLGVLFRLVDSGHAPTTSNGDGEAFAEGLTFNALRADLFRPEATAHIDAVGLGNAALQQVLSHLLLSKESRGRDRGFISYAELGINQLGAVYEGLMSYTGFFAETDLYEVAKNGDASKGSWVVPADRADGISTADFVKRNDPVTGEPKPVVHRQGSFVFRLAGRERQQSASYYTPEVLTRFTVGQALAELLDQDGRTTTAAEILELTVCEPALGSGAFAIEAVRQLAEQYLKRRQAELGVRLDPDEYPRRLQEVKAYLALHNVYGVDLNATAVELAEISLWLDTMVEGLSAPWFGLHLRRGNSLIGARRAVYRRSQVSDKSWLAEVPRDLPLTSLVADIEAERVATEGIHHFLLPADGWGAAAEVKEATALAPEAAKRLKAWRRGVKSKPTQHQVNALAELAQRVEVLWQIAYRRLSTAEQEVRRAIPVWEAGDLPAGGAAHRERVEAAIADPDGAYRRLRRVMDAWTALWFWPLTTETTTVDGERVEPPGLAQWIAGLQALLGRSPELRKRSLPRETLTAGASWDELNEAEKLELGLAHAVPVADVLRTHPWLVVCERVAQQQGFFHWNLDFVTVFARGGYSLQIGNPPWVRPRSDVDALLAEGDPWWQLAARTAQAEAARKRAATLALPGMIDFVVASTSETASTARFLGSVAQHSHLGGLQPDLYRCFMEQTWRHASAKGVIGLIHPESHFTDERAELLRKATYERLRRHWQFVNSLLLFEIKDNKLYGVNVYAGPRSDTRFLNAVWLYHPSTVDRSMAHDGSGPEPMLRDENDDWDLRPHAGRITVVDAEVLSAWASILGERPGERAPRMVYAQNKSALNVLTAAAASASIKSIEPAYSAGWAAGQDDGEGGHFDVSWGRAKNWGKAILQGPFFFVGTPFYKYPNQSMRNNQDTSPYDLEALAEDQLPIVSFAPSSGSTHYLESYTSWDDGSALDHFRVAWRTMADNVGQRTLMPALIPPRAAHVDSVTSLGLPGGRPKDLVSVLGFMSSLVADFCVRVAPKKHVRANVVDRLPVKLDGSLRAELLLRVLRLNCLTSAYSALWESCFDEQFLTDGWAGAGGRFIAALNDVGRYWSARVPLRRALERRQAQLEVDVIVAIELGISAEDLCALYATQFPVLSKFDRTKYFYDANGRLVPNPVLAAWRKKGDRITKEECTATNQAGNTYTYESPFVTLDREADMRQAYAHFERLLAERS